MLLTAYLLGAIMIEERTFTSLKEANKVLRKENKRMLKLSGLNGSPAEVDIVYFFLKLP